MAVTLVVLLSVLVSSLGQTIKVSDYVFWKKADIVAWHQYFPSRALEEERLTIVAAQVAATDVLEGLNSSLSRVVEYQAQELMIAQLMMEGANAQGCVKGISDFMIKAIEDEVYSYGNCAADALPKLRRLYSNWTKTNSAYQAVYVKTLQGIDSCAKTYPNKDSLSNLRFCVDSWSNKYYSVANSSNHNISNSPAMRVFTSTVPRCAEAAVQQVVSKGWTFFADLVQCAKLSDNMDWQSFNDKVTQGYAEFLTSNDLLYQTSIAQEMNIQAVRGLEAEMLSYYALQKDALQHHVIESRNQWFYSSKLGQELQTYFQTVTVAAEDNPGDVECSNTAFLTLKNVVKAGSSAAVKCDQSIVNNTQRLIKEVNDAFLRLNSVLPSVGNVAILSCYSQGYIFMEQTILKCFNLTTSNFIFQVEETHNTIVQDVQTLYGYSSFFKNYTLPCGDYVIRKAALAADQALFDLERCLYIGSGSKYPVAVPSGSYSYGTPV